MDIAAIVNLTRRRWTLAILAAMADGVSGRQAPLIAATGAPRSGFLDSLEHMIATGLLERNAGHGHPLRPEYRLTAAGTLAARMAAKTFAEVPDAGARKLLQKTWSLPILVTARRPVFFGQIRSALHPITDRALSETVKPMQEIGWLTREVDAASRPPRAIYEAVDQGMGIAECWNGPVSLG